MEPTTEHPHLAPITAGQAVDRGYGLGEIARLRISGEWAGLRRGIYLPGRPPDEAIEAHLCRASAALLALTGEDAALSYVSAAVAFGLEWPFGPDLGEIWVTRPPRRTTRRYPGLRVMPAALPGHHLTRARGLPVCTPARVVVDLARHRPFRVGVVLAESALRQGLVTADGLKEVLTDCAGWPYVRRAARVLAVVDDTTESVAESLARALFAEAGLTASAQVLITDRRGLVIARVDFLFWDWVVVEIDGRVKYEERSALFDEKRREDAIRACGYEVVRLTWSDLNGPIDAIVRRIYEARGRAVRSGRITP